MSLEQRFLAIDSLPKEFHKPIQLEKVVKHCVFCSKDNDYYYDIVREWYDVSDKTKFPRGLDPEKCPHDEWLIEKSIKLVELLRKSVQNNDDKFRDRGVSFTDTNHKSPRDVLCLLSDFDTMEFVILENVEFQRESLEKEITQDATRAGIAITFEQFEEINEIGQRKLKLLSEGKMDIEKLLKELHDYTKTFDPKVDDGKFLSVVNIINMFEERKSDDELCQEAIEMIKEMSEFIISLDAAKYDNRTELEKNYRTSDQWRYNLHSAKQNREKFLEWLEETELKLGRKVTVVDRIKSTQSL